MVDCIYICTDILFNQISYRCLSLVTIFTVSIILTYALRWLSGNKRGRKDSEDSKDSKDKKDKKDAEPAMDPMLYAVAVAPSQPHFETVSVVDLSHQPDVAHHS